jgi:hypothetical protein
MRIQVFDPAMCCPTGVCGPAVDPELARIQSDLAWLAAQGIEVQRFNLAQQPQAFVANPRVAGILRETGEAALPLVLWGDSVVSVGRYPSRQALASAAGLGEHSGDLGASSRPAPRGLRIKCEPGSGCCS